jgi:hypothetical protein
MAAKRSCWWYGIHLDVDDPESLAQLCDISNLALESMFDACGFTLPGKFSRDALMNFAQVILTCDVTEGKPAAFKEKKLKVGTGTTQGVASQYRIGSKVKRPSSTTRSLKSCQKRLQQSIQEWNLMKETICQPPSTPTVVTIAITTAQEPPSTPTPLRHISGVVASYEFLTQFIKPEALISTDLWQDDVDEKDFVEAIKKFVKVRRKANDLTLPIKALLGAKKIYQKPLISLSIHS